MPWGMDTVYPNMYIILCGPSASGKGIAMRPGQSLLKEIGIKLSSDAITREALIRQLAQCAETQPTEDGNPDFHSSLTIFSPEVAVFLGGQNTQLMSDLCDWFDCRDNWSYTTKGQGEDNILGVWVNLIGGTTPELLQTCLPRDAFGSGLMSRIIIVYVPRRAKTVAIPFLTKAENELRTKLLHDLERISIISGDYKMSNDAMEHWISIRHYIDKNPPFTDYRMEPYNGRKPHHVLKLSIIMSASRGDDKIIMPADIDRGLKVLEEAEGHMLKAFAGVGKARLSETLVRVMSYLATVKQVPEAQLLAQFHYDCDYEDMQKILLALIKMEAIGIIQGGVEGKERYIVYKKQVM